MSFTEAEPRSMARAPRLRFARLAVAALAVGAWAGVGCADRTAVSSPLPRSRAPTHRAPTQPKPRTDDRYTRASYHTVRLGRSVQGRPLALDVFGYGPDRVLIFAGIHGSEPTSATVATELVKHLHAHPELTAGRTVAVLPEANPDGLKKRRRTNTRGIDLNRNFPAKNWRRGQRHGPRAASEPETRAIMRAVKIIRPQRIVSIHSIARGRHCNNYDGPARQMAELMARRNDYPVRATMGYPTPGSFGSWAGIDRQIPTITLELPRDLDGTQCWRDNKDALLAFIQNRPRAVGR